jgi:phosphatidylglycerol:prolipoprotein diacylglycerol transferase
MKYSGELFFIYLIFSGTERLLVEFIRLNPKVIFIFTQAQLISIGMIILGIVFLVLFRNKRDEGLININSGNK